jgi:hypothetical protein
VFPKVLSAGSNQSLPRAASLQVRDIFSAAWPLFQSSLSVCLPLAVVGVAAGAVPGAEAERVGEPRGFLHSHEWWGVYVASTLLTLICYGGMLRHQWSLLQDERTPWMTTLGKSLRDLPFSVLVVLLALLPLVPPVMWIGMRQLDAAGWLLLAIGLVGMVFMMFSWPALLAERLGPWSAARRSIALVHAYKRAAFGVAGTLLAGVLVFVLLTGILMAVVMNLAGQQAQTGHLGLSFSRLLMAAVLSLPVVYAGAVALVAYDALSQADAHAAAVRSVG